MKLWQTSLTWEPKKALEKRLLKSRAHSQGMRMGMRMGERDSRAKEEG
jgi:hypothetical protein